MEAISDKIKRFLAISSGDGYGSGSGSGDGYGSGITLLNGQRVYVIDDVQTIIYSIHGNLANGAILQTDMTLKPCYIAKEGDYFAHGDTARQAMQDAHAKYMQNMPEEERIEEFVKTHPKYLELYPAIDLFEWHNILTGSCRIGREQFCRENNIDVEKDSFTVEDFVKLTAYSYGGETIKKLKNSYPTS